ncbi:hypothetical protein [Enemella sp. A6]|uniref:hypothetical protein n=1 Tax=Enemella sp. A6 TaxID=3440152 RepID=UPI003EB7BE4D
MRRMRVAVGLGITLVMLLVGLFTDAFDQHDGQGVASVHPGESWTTSLADVEIHSHAVDPEERTVSVEVTVVTRVDHPVLVREVLGFEVDGETMPFRSRAGDVDLTVLNPRVPVRLTVSYRPSDDEMHVQSVLVDGEWQTQDDNALLLPDHQVLTRPVAVIEP